VVVALAVVLVVVRTWVHLQELYLAQPE